MKRGTKDTSLSPDKLASPSAKVIKEDNDEIADAEATGTKKPRLERPMFPRDVFPRTSSPSEADSLLKIMSWNVAGLRTLIKNNGDNVADFLQSESPDVVFLQEHKLQTEHVAEHQEFFSKLGYTSFWTCSLDKKGYAGTAVLMNKNRLQLAPSVLESSTVASPAKTKPVAKTELKQQKLNFGAVPKKEVSSAVSTISQTPVTTVRSVVCDIDKPGIGGEGRLITVELDSLYLVGCYVPNSGEGLKRLDYRLNEWDPFLRQYLKDLHNKKPVILAGDLNVAHLDLDIYNHEAKHIVKQAGLTPQERASFGIMLGEGFVDALRFLRPNAVGQFTYWSKRTFAYDSNSGLRLDYFVCTNDLARNSTIAITGTTSSSSSDEKGPYIKDYYSRHDHSIVKCSDHCPIVLIVKV